jgi:hypothetical protein
VKGEFAPLWTARFETKNGDYHPVFVGSRNGPPIENRAVRRIAKAYLKEHADWLKKIDSIHKTYL